MKGTLRYWKAQLLRFKDYQEYCDDQANRYTNPREFELQQLYRRRARKMDLRIRRLAGYYVALRKGAK